MLSAASSLPQFSSLVADWLTQMVKNGREMQQLIHTVQFKFLVTIKKLKDII